MQKFKTSGVCAKEINFDVIDGRLKNVNFVGGCDGNAKGISALVEGMEIVDVAKRLKGITCGKKNSSCPAQLSSALFDLAANE
ncbi:MAG: TIGR03905 family TSCPD domain-containing protein [Desulfotalea sp.]